MYRTFSNGTKLLMYRKKFDFFFFVCDFLNNAHHTRNSYIIASNVISMEVLALIKRINSIFCNLCYSNQTEAQFEIIFKSLHSI